MAVGDSHDRRLHRLDCAVAFADGSHDRLPDPGTKNWPRVHREAVLAKGVSVSLAGWFPDDNAPPLNLEIRA